MAHLICPSFQLGLMNPGKRERGGRREREERRGRGGRKQTRRRRRWREVRRAREGISLIYILGGS